MKIINRFFYKQQLIKNISSKQEYINILQNNTENNEELFIKICSEYGDLLRYIPQKYHTYDICMASVTNSPCSLKYMTPEMQSFDICVKAIKSCSYSIEYIHNLTEDLALIALRINGDCISLIDERDHTLLMCQTAYKTTPKSVQYFRNELREHFECIKD